MQHLHKVLLQYLVTALLLTYLVSLMVLSSLPRMRMESNLQKNSGRHHTSGHASAVETEYRKNDSSIHIRHWRIPLLNDNAYNLNINQHHVCNSNEDLPQGPFLLVLIHSHFLHITQRHAIRDTWGRIRLDYDNPHYHVDIMFLLGSSNITKDNQAVYKEAMLYRDILQWQFLDTEQNNVLKSVLGFQWTRTHCPYVQYILKTNDVTYLNMSSIKLFLSKSQIFFVGYVNSLDRKNNTPLRYTGKKNLLKSHLKFCSGATFIISHDLLFAFCEILPASLDNMVFQGKDLYITEVIESRLNVTCKHIEAFPTLTTLVQPDTVFALITGDLFGVHGVPFEKMYSLWKIKETCYECTSNKMAVENWIEEEFHYANNYEGIEEGYTEA